MVGVALVLAGFLLGVLHDLAGHRRVPKAKPLLVALGFAAHVSGAYLLLVKSPRTAIPRPIRRAAALLSVTAFLGMVYSIAVEIPFRKAWIDRGHTSELVTEGTYSVSRHPGVLWASVWIPMSAVATGSRDLLRSWPLILVVDIAHVWLQDRVFLPSVFGDAYRQYQREVPFLIPRLPRGLRR